MPGLDDIATVASEWVNKAESDLTAAVQLLRLGTSGPLDAVCFHAQQCVEKYLKALLVFSRIDFPKTHDIEQLVSLLPRRLALALDYEDQALMTGYAIATRYPGSGEISLSGARHAIAVARHVRTKARAHLPRMAKIREKRRRMS